MKNRRTSLTRQAETFHNVLFKNIIEKGFYPSIFAQASLPYRNPGKGINVYQKSNGNVTINICQGYDDFSVPLGYPYGALPRLIILYLATEAIRTKSREISLGYNITDFLNRLNRSSDTRSRRRLIEQARRLFTCSFHFMGKSGGYVFGQNLNLIEQYSLWIGDGKNDLTPDLFAAKVQLNNEFFKEFTANNCFPINIEQIKGISESALAIDLYMWLVRRLYILKSPVNIEWCLLYTQFGMQYRRQRKFIEILRIEISRIKSIWPELSLDVSQNGITLKPSSLPISKAKSSCKRFELCNL